MKTGTEEHRAIDMEVASHVFVRENALSAVTSSPPTTDGGVGARQYGRQKGELDAQAEPGWSASSQRTVPD